MSITPPGPSFIDKWNFIKFFFVNDCSYPWRVYFETLWPATQKLSVTLVSFGWDDVVRGMFRPNPARKGRHGRKPPRPGRRKRGKSAIPEFGEMIGNRIGGAFNLGDRGVSDGVRHMWKIDAALQRHNYYWLIADGITTWTYDWTSGLMRHPETNCVGVGRMMRQRDRQQFTSGASFPINLPDLIYEQGMSSSATQASLAEGDNMICLSADVHWIGPFNEPATAQLRLEVAAGGNEQRFYSSRVVVAPGGNGQMIASANVRDADSVQWQVLRFGLANFELRNVECWILQHS